MIPEELDVDVMHRDDLEPEFAGKFPKPWLVVYPDGHIDHFDTEDEACRRQELHRHSIAHTFKEPPLLLQDEDKGLSGALAGAPHAKRNAVEAALFIAQTRCNDLGRANVHAVCALGEAREERDALRVLVGTIAGLKTEEEFGEDGMCGDDAVESLSDLIRQSRRLTSTNQD